QEGKPLGIAPIPTGLNAFVQTTDGFLASTGAIKRRPEGGEPIALLDAPSFGMGGDVGFRQPSRSILVSDGVGDQHTRPDDAPRLHLGVLDIVPLDQLFTGTPNSRAIPGLHERPDVRVSKPRPVPLLFSHLS